MSEENGVGVTRQWVDGAGRVLAQLQVPNGLSANDLERASAAFDRLPRVELDVMGSPGAWSIACAEEHRTAVESALRDLPQGSYSFRITAAGARRDAAPPDESALDAVRRMRDHRDRLEGELAAARVDLEQARDTIRAQEAERDAMRDEIEKARAELRVAQSGRDALCSANRSLVERDIRWRIASGSESPDELRARLSEAREIVGCDERASFLAKLREVVAELHDEREERCNVQVSAQRMLFERQQRESEPCSLPKPERVDVGQWWACHYEDLGSRVPFRVLSMNDIAAFGMNVRGVEHSGMLDAMVRDPRWRYLGNGERPDGSKRGDAESAESEEARMGETKVDVAVPSGVVQVSTSEIERVANEAREAVRAEMRDGLVRLFQRMGNAEWRVAIEAIQSYSTKRDDVAPAAHDAEHAREQRALSDLAKFAEEATGQRPGDMLDRFADRGEWAICVLRDYVDRLSKSVESLAASKVSLIRDVYLAMGVEPSPNLALVPDVRKRVAETVAHVKRLEEQLSGARGREHGPREYVAARDDESLRDAIARVVRETADIATALAAGERDAAYRRGQEEMRGRAAASVVAPSPDTHVTRGEFAARVSALPIANAPAVSASGEPGEVDPGRGGTETAGAGDSVAREGGGASEVERLRAALVEAGSKLRAHERDVVAWRAATESDTPEKARQKIACLRGCIRGDAMQLEQRANEIANLKRKLSKARRDANRGSVAPSEQADAASMANGAIQERIPQMGDIVLYEHRERASTAPALVIHVHEDGALDLRVMDTLELRSVVCEGVAAGTWRFRV